ncbi:MAG: AI-2E family transporter [Bacilli bacterium]|nr:AI-2E family transporter [Bacilli bacterium]
MNQKDNDKLDVKKVNELVSLSKKILNIAYIFIIILGIYAVTILFKEWKIIDFFKNLLAIISPLFIGLLIAWLFEPAVTYFKKKGLKKTTSAAIVYAIFIGILALILGTLLPMLSNQINDFVKTLPNVFDSIMNWIDGIFDNFKNIEGFNVDNVKSNVFSNIEAYSNTLTSSLPTIIVSIISSLLSWIGVILVGLIIGFYILISFDNIDDVFEFLPKQAEEDTRNVIDAVNKSLRKFVQGALIDSTLVFVVSSIALWIVGLKAPLLFGLFCGITNIIPYAGPYIGGAPAVIVGFSQSPTTGFLTLLMIAIIQLIEGNFFQPIIMSKTTKLHPVTIMIGLLVFGYFFGIIGMVISTPLIAAFKAIFMYFNNKYQFIKMN